MRSDEYIIEFVVEVAKEAGVHIKTAFYDRDSSVESKDSLGLDIVTATDKFVENLVKTRLSKEFPEWNFIGEETFLDLSSTEISKSFYNSYTWVVDPIDGTTNFVHGFPFTCISIGLCFNGNPIIGVVYNPILDELYTGIKGKGSFFNGRRLPLFQNNSQKLSEQMLASEFGSDRTAKAMDTKLDIIKDAVYAPSRAIRCLGSAALAMCYVARGTMDVFWEAGIHLWDVAAATIIIREAQGMVSNWSKRNDPLDLLNRKFLAVSSAGNSIETRKKLENFKQYLRDIELDPDFK